MEPCPRVPPGKRRGLGRRRQGQSPARNFCLNELGDAPKTVAQFPTHFDQGARWSKMRSGSV
eukprot:11187832-Lingulodinium_polyedra.AAC.1